MASRVWVGIIVGAAACLMAVPSYAGKNRNNGMHADREHQQGAQLGNLSAVDSYLRDDLGLEHFEDFDLTLKLKKTVANKGEDFTAERGKLSPEAKERALKYFSPRSAKTIVEIIKAMAETEYANPVVLGPAGVGKTHLQNQLVAVLSYGVMPDYLAAELGLPTDGSPIPEDHPYKKVLDAIGKIDLVLVNPKLLAVDNTPPGKAFAKAEDRGKTLVADLLKLPRTELERSGRRTLFLAEEVARLPDYLIQALKEPLDESGFHDPTDVEEVAKDAGFSFLPMTTPDEWRRAVEKGDNAIRRRFVRIDVEEPGEAEALDILIDKSIQWEKLYGVSVDVDALEYIIQSRKLFTSTPLAMPGSVIKPANRLFLSLLGKAKKLAAEQGTKPVITLALAQEFVAKEAGLSKATLPGPEGQAPLYDLAAQLKARVMGQDEIMDRIARVVKEGVRNNFAEGLPVLVFAGPPGSGKDTTVNALNEILLGRTRPDLNFSVAGASSKAFSEIIESGPGGDLPFMAQALDRDGKGVILINETKDLPGESFEKLKVLVEQGAIQGRGTDTRTFLLNFNILVLNGQYGEELFAGKTDEEIEQIYKNITQQQLEELLLKGKDGKVGAFPPALIDRIKKAGGIFLFRPVPKAEFPKIIELHLKKIRASFLMSRKIELLVDPTLIQFISDLTAAEKGGPRALGGNTVDFTRVAISEAWDQGLAQRNAAIRVRHERDGAGKDKIVVEQLQGQGAEQKVAKSFSFDPASIRRTKAVEACEAKLLGG